MKFAIFVAAVASVVTFESAQASREVGNGGDAVVCYDSTTGARKSVQLYDYYEATAVRRLFDIEFGTTATTVEEALAEVVDRIERLNPTRAALYREWFNSFYPETVVVRGVDLVDIPDTADGFVPTGCKLEQLALQREPRLPGEKRYTLNGDLYDRMSIQDRAGLILHELILREVRSLPNPHVNSINARYFNGFVASKQYASVNLKGYLETLFLLDIPRGDAQGGFPLEFKTSSNATASTAIEIEFSDDHTVKRARVVGRTTYEWRGQKIELDFLGGDRIEFHPSGIPSELRVASGQSVNLVKDPTAATGVSVSVIHLRPDGSPVKADGKIEVRYPSTGEAKFKGTCRNIEFFDDGKLRSCKTSAQGEVLLNGASFPLDVNRTVEFHDTGILATADALIQIVEPTANGQCQFPRFDSAGRWRACASFSGDVKVGTEWMAQNGGAIRIDDNGRLREVGAVGKLILPNVKGFAKSAVWDEAGVLETVTILVGEFLYVDVDGAGYWTPGEGMLTFEKGVLRALHGTAQFDFSRFHGECGGRPSVYKRRKITFNEHGTLIDCPLAIDRGNPKVSYLNRGVWIKTDGSHGWIEFFPSGAIFRAPGVRKSDSVNLPKTGAGTELEVFNVRFFENGLVESAVIRQPTTLPIGATTQQFNTGAVVRFDQHGVVVAQCGSINRCPIVL